MHLLNGFVAFFYVQPPLPGLTAQHINDQMCGVPRAVDAIDDITDLEQLKDFVCLLYAVLSVHFHGHLRIGGSDEVGVDLEIGIEGIHGVDIVQHEWNIIRYMCIDAGHGEMQYRMLIVRGMSEIVQPGGLYGLS